MSDIKLFHLSAGKASALKGHASDLEKPLQTLIENNLEILLGVKFLATEYSTGKRMEVVLIALDWMKITVR